jgi:hypothetical protein
VESPTAHRLNTFNGASINAKKTPAISTLRNERTVLNQIFRFAKRKGYISDPPQSQFHRRGKIPELISRKRSGARFIRICVAT